MVHVSFSCLRVSVEVAPISSSEVAGLSVYLYPLLGFRREVLTVRYPVEYIKRNRIEIKCGHTMISAYM